MTWIHNPRAQKGSGVLSICGVSAPMTQKSLDGLHIYLSEIQAALAPLKEAVEGLESLGCTVDVQISLGTFRLSPGKAKPREERPRLSRPDGVGPKGSSDPFALTSLDHHVVDPQLPRDHRRKK